MSYNTAEKKLKAVLVHINVDDAEPNGTELLEELSLLCESCNMQTVATMQQNLKEPNPPTLIGSGKLAELKTLCRELNADVVVFDNDLSGMKKKNIENEINLDVLTRSMVVLDIFAMRSKTAEGKLQTEIAQLKYYLPRLIGMDNVANGKFGAGGVGTRGPGETKLELDRRKIKDRISRLESDLKKLKQNKETSTKKRAGYGTSAVAIVGYTNAGKSTLFNAITKANVLSKNMLFATLETVTRYVYITEKTQILLSDTVGFISKLPHEFVEAFKTTLSEACNAKILLIVVDASSANAYSEFCVVKKVLAEIGAHGKQIVAINKCDKNINTNDIKKIESENKQTCVRISATKNQGVDQLKKIIEKTLQSLHTL